MGLGIHIRVDTNGDGCSATQTGGAFVHRQHFLGRFQIKHEYALLERINDFLFCLTDSGKNDLFWLNSCLQGAETMSIPAPREANRCSMAILEQDFTEKQVR